MPELPEVETIVRSLAPRLLHHRIEQIEIRQPRVVVGDVTRAAGFTVTGVQRRAKFILIDLRKRARAAHLIIHLGMTGQLLLEGQPGRHTHALFALDRGLTLLYNDTRQFGRIQFVEKLPARFERLGPDPFDLDEEAFVRRFRSRRSMAKSLLLNQTFLGGIGNIYADEALFRARIHPRAASDRLRLARVRELYRSIVGVLTEAITHGGSSVSNYVSSDGRRGSFQVHHQVYGRTGQPCPVCTALIRRIVVASRGTHLCPQCQRQ